MYENPLNAAPNPPPAGQPVGYPAYPSAPPPMGNPSANPYAPPVADFDATPTYEDEGSYGLGIAVGFIFAIIGLIIVLIAGKSATKRGALHGFLARIGFSVLMFAIFGVFR